MSHAYQVTHRTDYRYERDVTASYGHLHLLPRDLDRQRRRSATITLTPAPGRTSSATACPTSRSTSLIVS